MSKRPPSREDDGEPEAKRLALALAKRANELQQNNAPFGLYQELMPELKLLIAWKMPLRELINWLQTEKALTEPKFLVLFWQTLVKADYRSPLTGKLHRFVEHAEAAFNQYCVLKGLAPTTHAWFEVAAKFWHATFFNASTATRYALYILAECRAYEIWQEPEEFARAIGVKDASLVKSTAEPFMFDLVEHERDEEATKFRRFAPLLAEDTIARNNWLALASDSPRRRAGIVFFTRTDYEWEIASGESPPRMTAEQTLFTDGISLRLGTVRDPEWVRLSDTSHARLMPSDETLALRGVAGPGDQMLFKWAGRPLIRGTMNHEGYRREAYFELNVDAIDIDGMLDWAAAHVKGATSRDEAYMCATWVLRDGYRSPFAVHRGGDERIDNVPRFTAQVVHPNGRGRNYYRLAFLPLDEVAADHADNPRDAVIVFVEQRLLRVNVPLDRPPTYFSSDTT